MWVGLQVGPLGLLAGRCTPLQGLCALPLLVSRGSTLFGAPSFLHPATTPNARPPPPPPARPQDYIHRLDNFDGPAVAEKAIEFGLAEEAYEIYKKFNKRVEAVKVGMGGGKWMRLRTWSGAERACVSPPMSGHWAGRCACGEMHGGIFNTIRRHATSLACHPPNTTNTIETCPAISPPYTCTHNKALTPSPPPPSPPLPPLPRGQRNRCCCHPHTHTQVLLEQLKDIPRAAEWAAKCDEAPVWSELAHAQLAAGQVAEAIASYLKAGDSSRWGRGRGSERPASRPSSEQAGTSSAT